MQNITVNHTDVMSFQGREAYKTMRMNVRFIGEDVKVIAVTSCMPNEGKSSVTMNLALSLAEAGEKVLLIDADMRKSVLTGRYKIKNAKMGLSHYLSGQCTLEEVNCITNVENFFMIVSGTVPPNPSELLGHKRFKKMIEDLRTVYDYILIDSPPMGSVADAVIAGKVADGVLLVVESEAVSYKYAQKIKKQLEMAECKILGVVLNKVNLKKREYYGRYYGKYYGKYYGGYHNTYDTNEE